MFLQILPMLEDLKEKVSHKGQVIVQPKILKCFIFLVAHHDKECTHQDEYPGLTIFQA